MEPSRRTSASSSSRRQRSSSVSSIVSTASTSSTISSITDEDHDLIASAAIPDGFRPSRTVPSSRRPVSPSSGPLLPPPQAVNPSFSKWNHRPSSTAKPPRPHDSLAIRADGSSITSASQTGGNGVPPLRMETPYRGPSNPVHPYGMYPQRTASTHTDRSARGNRSSYTGPRSPAHPYTLYSQGTPGEANQQAIPVGFTGMTAPYQRQIGPDGEDVGDLLGPLGHMEELPPYTRYPEVAFTAKPATVTSALAADTPAAAAADASPVQSNREGDASDSQPAAAVASTPILAVEPNATAAAPENPFASAEDDLVPTNSRGSIRTLSTYRDDSSEQSLSEKQPRFRTTWERRARKKLWGVIPYWSICLVFVGMIIMGVVMGAVVGTVLTKSRKRPHQKPFQDQLPSPTAVDLQPLQTVPASLLPLPVGTFSLPQLDGGRARRFCVNDTSQHAAWSCNMAFRFYSFNIVADDKQPATQLYNLTLTPINNTQSQFIWGTQPPFIKDPITLKLVNESIDRGRGPAWWTTVSYDKTVIVQEPDLSPPQKRGLFYPGPQAATVADLEKSKLIKQSFQAESGEYMWICTWPQTTMEILVYPGQNTPGTASSTPTSASSAPTPTNSGVFGDYDLDMPNEPLSPYPRLVRMLERRPPNCDPAKCRKYKMLRYGGKAVLQNGPDGKPIEIEIAENKNMVRNFAHPGQPPVTARSEIADREADHEGSGLVPRTALDYTPCGCLWSQ